MVQCVYPLHYERRKSAHFVPHLDDGAILSLCNLKTTLQTEKLRIFLMHNCQASYRSAYCSC